MIVQNCGFDAGKRHEFVRMALFLIDSSTLLSQPHNAPTSGGAKRVFWEFGILCFYGPFMGISMNETGYSE